MWPYILTFIAVAVFPLALAGYGGHLATLALPENSKAKRKALFIVWGLAIIGVVLFGVSQVTTYRGDKVRDGKDQTFQAGVLGKLQTIIDEPNIAKMKEDATALKAVITNRKDTTVVPPLPLLPKTTETATPSVPYTPSPAPLPPEPRPTTLTPYDELKQAYDQVLMVNGEWQGDIQTINQRLVAPWKFGHEQGPLPTGLTKELAQRLAEEDGMVTQRYRDIQQRIRDAHDHAIARMKQPGPKQLTPNQIAEDTVAFQKADRTAATPTSIADMEANKPNMLRFQEMRYYLENLLQELGNYPQ